MNAQQESVAMWQYLESRGLQPSIRKVAATMRSAGMPINDHMARKYLAEFSAAAPHPKAHRRKITARTEHITRTQDAHPPHEVRADVALYAGDKVSLVSKKEASPPVPAAQASPLLAEPSPVAKPKRAPVQPRLDVRTPAQIIADEVLVAIHPGIQGALHGKTWTTWRGQNRSKIADMAAAGCSAEEIIDAWEAGSERRGYTVLAMGWIADDLDRQVGVPEQNDSNRLPTNLQLIAAGKAEPVSDAEVIANRPAWFNAQLASASA